MRVRIFQKVHQQGRREVIIIGQSATVGNLIVFRVMPQATDQFHNLDNTIFGSYLLLSRSLRPQATKKCFRIEIITLFHQLVQRFLHGSIPASHPFYSHTITRQFGKAIRLGSRDSFPTKTLQESMHKETGRVVDVYIVLSDRSDISRNKEIVSIRQPVSRERESSGRRGTCFRLIRHCIIGGYRLTGNTRGISLHRRGNNRNLYSPLAKHQWRQIGLIARRSIVPCPSTTPIKGVFHRNVTIYLSVNHRKRESDYLFYQ